MHTRALPLSTVPKEITQAFQRKYLSLNSGLVFLYYVQSAVKSLTACAGLCRFSFIDFPLAYEHMAWCIDVRREAFSAESQHNYCV